MAGIRSSRWAAALVLALVASSSSLLSARGQTPITGPIKHVVLLMQENRSFDHMLGWLKVENPEVDGVNGTEWNPRDPNDPNDPEKFYVTNNAIYITDPDPGHDNNDMKRQAYGTTEIYPSEATGGGENKGYVYDYVRRSTANPQDVMDVFDADALPVFYTLAREYAVFDQWHCQATPTMPNRYFVLSASSSGLAQNNNTAMYIGFKQKSIFRHLNDNGHDWMSYFLESPTPLVFKDVRRRDARKKFRHMKQFYEDVRAGVLPAFSFIDPRYGHLPYFPQNDDHPAADVSLGQKMMKNIYEALRRSPLWESTLFIITYDEHGGFYDHVPFPVVGVPNPDGKVSPDPDYKFDYLGPRVPTIMISPWIAKGTVVHNPPNGPTATSKYEHSSVAATLKHMFNLNNFLNERDAWAGTFEHLWANTTMRTDCLETLPEPTSLAHRQQTTGHEVQNGLQRGFLEMAAGLNGVELEATSTYTVMQGSRMTQRYLNKYFGRDLYPPEESPVYATEPGIEKTFIDLD